MRKRSIKPWKRTFTGKIKISRLKEIKNKLYIVIGIINVLVIIYATDHVITVFMGSLFVILCFGGVTWYLGKDSKKCDCK